MENEMMTNEVTTNSDVEKQENAFQEQQNESVETQTSHSEAVAVSVENRVDEQKDETANNLNEEEENSIIISEKLVLWWRYFVRGVTKKYVSFKGRANQDEFIGVTLYCFLFYSLARLIGSYIGWMVFFAILCPLGMVLLRRAHDMGESNEYAIKQGALAFAAWGGFKLIMFYKNLFSFIDAVVVIVLLFFVGICILAGFVWVLLPFYRTPSAKIEIQSSKE